MVNLDYMNNVFGFADLLINLNTATNGVFSLAFMFFSWLSITMIMSNKGYDFDDISIYSGGFLFLISGLFIYLEVVNIYYMMPPLLFIFVGVLLKFAQQD